MCTGGYGEADKTGVNDKRLVTNALAPKGRLKAISLPPHGVVLRSRTYRRCFRAKHVLRVSSEGACSVRPEHRVGRTVTPGRRKNFKLNMATTQGKSKMLAKNLLEALNMRKQYILNKYPAGDDYETLIIEQRILKGCPRTNNYRLDYSDPIAILDYAPYEQEYVEDCKYREMRNKCIQDPFAVKIQHFGVELYLKLVKKDPIVKSYEDLISVLDGMSPEVYYASDLIEGVPHYIPFQLVTMPIQAFEVLGVILRQFHHKWKVLSPKDRIFTSQWKFVCAYQEFDYSTLDKIRFYHPMDSFYREDPYIPSLLTIGNVETNPGPVVKIPSLGLRTEESGDNVTIITTNNTSLTFPKGRGTWTASGLTIELSEEELQRFGRFEQNREKSYVVVQPDPVKKIYSNHQNFDPSKRLMVKPKDDFFGKMNIQYPLEETEGLLVRIENFQFIPRNLMHMKIGTNHCEYNNINSNKYRFARDSVCKQEMTDDQLVEYASLVTTIQMHTMQSKKLVKEAIKLYFRLFMKNFEHLRKVASIIMSQEEAWERLKSFSVYVPMPPVYYGNPIEVLQTQTESYSDVPLYEQLSAVDSTDEYYQYGTDGTQVLRDYAAGLTTHPDAVIADFTFDFKMVPNKIPLTLRDMTVDLTPREQFLKKLVEQRLLVADFSLAVTNALDGMDDDVIIDMVQRISGKIWTSALTANLHGMLRNHLENGSSDPENEPAYKVTYDKYRQEYLIARRMQLEFMIFAQELGIKTNANVFNTVQNIRILWAYRHRTTEPVVLGFDKIKEGYTHLKEILTASYDTKNTMREVNQMWEDHKEKIARVLNLSQASPLHEAFMENDFSSFSNSLASVKAIINAMFDAVMGKLCGIFQIEYKHTFDATTATLYYLVWNNTNCQVLRYLLVLDILGQLGIVDIALAALRSAGSVVSSLWNKITSVSMTDEELDQFIEERKEVTKAIYEQTKPQEPAPEPKESEDVNIFSRLMTAIDSDSPILYGGIAIAIAGLFGIPKQTLQKYDMNILGNSLVATMKNLSIIAGGLLAVPKIVSYLIVAFKWIVDEVRGLVSSKHVTKRQWQSRAVKWISDVVPFISEHFTQLLPRRPELSLRWVELENERIKIMTNSIKLSKDLLISFNRTSNAFQNNKEKVMTAIENMFGLDEMLHFQFYSDPGLGKTDILRKTVIELSKEWTQIGLDRAGTVEGNMGRILMINALFESFSAPDRYAYNEVLKHMDGYNHQMFLVNDDTNIFKDPAAENVQQFIQMVSGSPVTASMADLSEKGKIVDSKFLISCTNNAFPKFDNVLTMDAIFRRRRLIRVRESPEFKAFREAHKEMDLNGQIARYCREKGFQRTSSQHLVFDVLDPVDPSEKLLVFSGNGRQTRLEGLTPSQIQKYMRSEARMHFASEWKRNHDIDPFLHRLRTIYHALKDKSLFEEIKVDAESLMKNGEKLLQTHYDKIGAEVLKQLRRENPDVKEDVFKNVRDKVLHRLTLDKEFIKNYNTNYEFDFENCTRPVSGRTCNFKLLKHKVEGSDCTSYVYVIQEDNAENSYCSGDINWRNVFYDNFRTQSGIESGKTARYVVDKELTELEESVVLGNLAEVMSHASFFREAFIERKRKKMSSDSFSESYLAAIKYNMMRAADASVCFTEWLGRKVITFLGEKVVHGIATAFGLMALFATLAVTGAMLAPPTTSPTSYNNNPKKIVIPGVKHTMPVSRFEEGVPAEADYYKTYLKSVFRAKVTGSRGETSQFQMTAYEGNIFVANKHSFKNISYPAKIKIADPAVTQIIREYELNQYQVKEVPNNDYVLIALPDFRPARGLRKHWITEVELSDNMINLRRAQVSLISVQNDQGLFEGAHKIEILLGMPVFVVENHEPVLQHNSRVIQINQRVKHGQSGSLALHSNPCLQNEILGTVRKGDQFVISGTAISTNLVQEASYIGVVSREDLDKVYRQFDQKFCIEVNLYEAPELTPEEEPLVGVFKYGQVVKPSPFRELGVPIQSGFKKTCLYGLFPSEVEPAGQVANDPRFPPGSRHFLEVSLNKSAGINQLILTDETEKFAYNYLKAIYGRFIPEVLLARVISIAQAITGLRMKGSNSMDLSTIAGLPYMLEKGVVGKSPFITFDKENNSYNIQNRIISEVARYIESYRQNIVPQNFKVEFRKHELVGRNKIEQPKTRTVGMGNLIHQILYMMLFKDHHTCTKNIWNEGRTCPFAMGLDAERQWDQVAEHLIYVDHVIDLDVKAWEEKISQRSMFLTAKVKLDHLKASAKIRGEKWDPINEKIAYGLVTDYIHTDVVFQNICYEKMAGLVSGHPGTFMENSEIHEIVFGLIMRHILKTYAPHLATIPYIIENCRSIKAADDILIALSPSARTVITPARIKEAYNMLGFEITAPDKTDNISVKTLEEVQFLKNGFIKRGGKYEIYPNESQIHQLVNWVRTRTALPPDLQLQTNLATALRFAYWRGRDYYEDVREQINNRCVKVAFPFYWGSDYDEMTVIIKRNHEDEMNRYLVPVDNERTDEVFRLD